MLSFTTLATLCTTSPTLPTTELKACGIVFVKKSGTDFVKKLPRSLKKPMVI
jgi:hypothetical protein